MKSLHTTIHLCKSSDMAVFAIRRTTDGLFRCEDGSFRGLEGNRDAVDTRCCQFHWQGEDLSLVNCEVVALATAVVITAVAIK